MCRQGKAERALCMQERRNVRQIATELDLAYLAGIIDGEGTIGIYKGAEPFNYHLALIITNTYAPMLDWVRARTGGSLTRHTPETARHKQGWQVVVWQARAADVIRLCQPYLIVKAQQADLALRFMSDYVSFRGRNSPVTEEQVAKRRWYYEQSLAINGGKRTGRPKKKRA